jgi:hypothetical protein
VAVEGIFLGIGNLSDAFRLWKDGVMAHRIKKYPHIIAEK